MREYDVNQNPIHNELWWNDLREWVKDTKIDNWVSFENPEVKRKKEAANSRSINVFLCATDFWEFLQSDRYFLLFGKMTMQETMIEWLLQPCTDDWWEPHQMGQRFPGSASESKPVNTDVVWTLEGRINSDVPLTRLEYWSHTWIEEGDGQTRYMGFQFDTNKQAFEFQKKQYKVAWYIWQAIWEPVFLTEALSQVLPYEGTGLRGKQGEWSDVEMKAVEVLCLNQATYTLDDFTHAFNKDRLPYIGKRGDRLDPYQYLVLLRLLRTEGGSVAPFNPSGMTGYEKIVFSSNQGGTAHFQSQTMGAFVAKVRKHLRNGLEDPIWNGDIPTSGGATKVAKGMDMDSWENSPGSKEYTTPWNGKTGRSVQYHDKDAIPLADDLWGLEYGHGTTQKDAINKAEHDDGAQHFEYTSTNNIGDMYLMTIVSPKGPDDWFNLDYRGDAGGATEIQQGDLFEEYRESIATLWRGGEYGFIQQYNTRANSIQLKESWVSGPLDLTDYKASGFTYWTNVLKGTENAYGPSLADTDECKAYTPTRIKARPFGSAGVPLAGNMNMGEDIRGINPTSKIQGDYMSLTHPKEDTQKLIDDLTASLLELAGDEDKGFGSRNWLDKTWYDENLLGDGLVPTSKSFATTIDLTGGTTYEGVSKDVLSKISEIFERSEQVTFDKIPEPWACIRANVSGFMGIDAFTDRTEDIQEIPFIQIVERHFMSAYLTALYYKRYQSVNGGRLLVHDIVDMHAQRCAYHMMRLWNRIVHDNTVGNFYALIVAVLAEIEDEEIDPELADALRSMVEGATEDMGNQMSTEEVADISQDTVSESDKDQRERFFKQCSLMLNMHRLDSINKRMTGIYHEQSLHSKYGSYNGRIHLVTNNDRSSGKKNAIINKLLTPRPNHTKRFIDLKPADAAKLLPIVRFWKVWNDPTGGLKEVEFNFPTTIDASGYDQDTGLGLGRGSGMGLQEFSWEYDGETPATASKYIKANCTFMFQNFNDFVQERVNTKGHKFRWVDMFVSPTNMVLNSDDGYNVPHHLRYDPEYYRIRVQVGYAETGDKGLDISLTKQTSNFFLVLIDHDININEDLTVTITANYRAYIEEAMDSNKFNALSSPETEALKEKQRVSWEKALEAYKDGKCSDEMLRDVRNVINEEMAILVKKQHKAIMTNLLNHGRIHYIDFKEPHIEQFRQTGQFKKIPGWEETKNVRGLDDDAGKHFKELIAKGKKDVPWKEHPEPYKGLRVYYFYFGDLIYLLNSNLYNKKKGGTDYYPWVSSGTIKDEEYYKSGAEGTKFILCDFDYHNNLHPTNSRQTINIADIPISVDFFFEWYIDNVIKNNILTMGIGTFIRRLLTDLITSGMAEVCLTSEEGHYTTFQIGNMTACGMNIAEEGKDPVYLDPILAGMASNPFKEDNSAEMYRLDVNRFYADGTFVPIKREGNPAAGLYNYVMIYGDFADPFHDGVGDRIEDETRGIYHLDLGRDSGLVKTISFSKNNIPYHRESRMFNQGQAGLLQLSAVYNCDIKMIGNTLFLPGMEIWVNPYGFGGPSFGKPQDPPLKFSTKAADIIAYNKEYESRKKDGLDNDDLKYLITRSDELQQTEREQQKKKHLVTVNSYANVMGIGGYQLIIRIKCSITPGKYETTLSAKHVYSGYPQLKESHKMIEFRREQPNGIEDNDSSTQDACAAILADYDQKFGGNR